MIEYVIDDIKIVLKCDKLKPQSEVLPFSLLRHHIDFARVKILIAIALHMFSVPVLLGKNSPIFPPLYVLRGVGQRTENLAISLPPRGVIVA